MKRKERKGVWRGRGRGFYRLKHMTSHPPPENLRPHPRQRKQEIRPSFFDPMAVYKLGLPAATVTPAWKRRYTPSQCGPSPPPKVVLTKAKKETTRTLQPLVPEKGHWCYSGCVSASPLADASLLVFAKSRELGDLILPLPPCPHPLLPGNLAAPLIRK